MRLKIPSGLLALIYERVKNAAKVQRSATKL
jgi:hypothetical protein